MTTATEDQPVGTTGPLEGRAALVTGSVHGIASVASRHLAADGAQVPSGLATSYITGPTRAVDGGLDT
jgi:hypothetical protein